MNIIIGGLNGNNGVVSIKGGMKRWGISTEWLKFSLIDYGVGPQTASPAMVSPTTPSVFCAIRSLNLCNTCSPDALSHDSSGMRCSLGAARPPPLHAAMMTSWGGLDLPSLAASAEDWPPLAPAILTCWWIWKQRYGYAVA